MDVQFAKVKSRLVLHLFANHLTVNFVSFCQQRISHLVGLLCDGGKPVLLVGEAGCGKTSILRHRLKQHGGDIGEVLSLTVFCNKFTTSRSLWKEMSSCLEWKHARTFVPKGNKRLTCLVDDLNLSRVSVDIDSYHPVIKKEGIWEEYHFAVVGETVAREKRREAVFSPVTFPQASARFLSLQMSSRF